MAKRNGDTSQGRIRQRAQCRIWQVPNLVLWTSNGFSRWQVADSLDVEQLCQDGRAQVHLLLRKDH